MSSKYYWREKVIKTIPLKPRGKKRKSVAKRKEWIKKYGESLFTFPSNPSNNPPSPPVYFSSRDEFLKIYNK